MTSSAPAARGDAASHTHTHTHSVPQSLIRALPLGIVQKQHVLFGALQAGFSNKRVLDSSYEATVIGGARVSIGPAITILKNAIGRKVSGADLQVLQALIVALIMLEGERFRTVIPSLTFSAPRRTGIPPSSLWLIPSRREGLLLPSFYDSCAKHSLHLWMRFHQCPWWNPFVRSM